MSNNNPIKKKIFGGFNRDQVDQYLLSLRSEYDRAMQESDVDSINKQITALKEAIRGKNEKIENLKKQLTQIEAENGNGSFVQDIQNNGFSDTVTDESQSDSSDEFPDIQPGYFSGLFFDSPLQSDYNDPMPKNDLSIESVKDLDAVNDEIKKEKNQNDLIEKEAAKKNIDDNRLPDKIQESSEKNQNETDSYSSDSYFSLDY